MGSLRNIQRKAAQPGPVPAQRAGNWYKYLLQHFRAIFAGRVLLNASIVTAILIGFIHGWLKLKFRSPITTFAVDIFLAIGLLAILLQKNVAERVFPPGKVSQALMAFYALCAVYLIPTLFLPSMPPILMAAVSIRGWCFSSLMFIVGYHLIQNAVQLRGYFYLLIAIGLFTAIYGIRQTPEDVQAIIEANPDLARQYETQRFVDDEGDLHLRRFSTFISSGAFGGTMASVLVFSVALITDQRSGWLARLFLVLVSVPMAYGLLLSGARSALLSLGFGIAMIFWLRKSLGILLVGAVLLGVGGILASLVSEGGTTDRIKSLNLDTIVGRFWVPTRVGLDYMSGHLLGGGLGKTGHLPAFLGRYTGYSDFKRSDGDLGRLMIELGIPGVLVFTYVLAVTGREVIRIARATANTPEGSLALGSAANFLICVLTFPTGSPFVSVPMGLLVWFFLGATQRIAELAGGTERPAEGVVAVSARNRRRHRTNALTPALANAALPQVPVPATPVPPARPPKRFLYYKPPVRPAP